MGFIRFQPSATRREFMCLGVPQCEGASDIARGSEDIESRRLEE